MHAKLMWSSVLDFWRDGQIGNFCVSCSVRCDCVFLHMSWSLIDCLIEASQQGDFGPWSRVDKARETPFLRDHMSSYRHYINFEWGIAYICNIEVWRVNVPLWWRVIQKSPSFVPRHLIVDAIGHHNINLRDKWKSTNVCDWQASMIGW